MTESPGPRAGWNEEMSNMASTADPVGGPAAGSELETFMTLAHKLLWSPADTRDRIQAGGIHLLPCNYYSTVPSVAEIRDSFEHCEPQAPIYTQPFDDQRLLAFLAQIEPYACEFSPPTEGSEEAPAAFFWNNSQFSHSDAMTYFAIVRHRKPRRIIEIGSGFSTLVAAQALDNNGFGEIVCIDPYPRDLLARIPRAHVVAKKIQELSRDEFLSLCETADILFIDSTHTVKIGSDCLFIYLHLIPALRQQMLIHAHDIFLPFGMPVEWALNHHIYWTEQYLLYALLLDNPYLSVELGTAYLQHFHKPALDRFMGGKASSSGASLWMRLSR
jgi:predicted O-methyltransferase YrrM